MPRLRGDTSISSSANAGQSIARNYKVRRTDGNTLRIDQIIQRILNEFRQVVREMLMANVMQVIIIRVLRHPPIEVRPRQNVLLRSLISAR